MKSCFHLIAYATIFVFALANHGSSQIRITEILADSVNNDTSEWIEIQNISGTPLDLSGFVYDDDDDNALTTTNLSGENMVLPANGLAILYDGNDYDVPRFRSAWNLDPSVQLIAVDNPPRLGNGGDSIGLWSSLDNYLLDIADEDLDGDMEVVQFTNAVSAVAYGDGFPSGNNTSFSYSGSGDITVGENWVLSQSGLHGATTSVQTFLDGIPINSVEDIGNPGIIPEGPMAEGLIISEVMFNPRSDPDNSQEWVEIVNNTGVEINFAETPYYFDDDDDGDLSEPNVTEGVIAQGGVAVLFNSGAVTEQNMKDAWGENVNFIPVSSFSALSNGGELIGIWNDRDTYLENREVEAFLDALAAVEYDDNDDEGWPVDDGMGSYYMPDLTADPFVGNSWRLSAAEDGISFNAMEVKETVVDHEGGDVASPGVWVDVSNLSDGDFDSDGDLDADDIDALTAAVALGEGDEPFDVNGDGNINADDRVMWVEVLANTYFGDANLDGEFNSADFVLVFQFGEYEDATDDNSTWAEGDWDGDGDFTSSDFVTAFIGAGFEIGPRDAVAAVPEPTGPLTLLLSLVGLFVARKRK